MPYSKESDARINKIISTWKGTSRKKMFGGICYLIRGNMFSGVYKDFLILRLGEKGAAEALRAEHVRPMDITGKPMKGWVMVAQKGFQDDEALAGWLDEAREFVKSLPGK